MRYLCITAVIVIVFLGIAVSADEYYPVVRQYELDASFIPDQAWIHGRATVTFTDETNYQKTATCYLHAELQVDSVVIAGKPVAIEQDKIVYAYDYCHVATRVRIPLTGAADLGEVTVYYQGAMNPSKIGSPSNYMRIDHDGVFLRSYGYSLWFPAFLPDCSDDYAVDFSRVIIRTPAEFRSVFQGQMTDERFENGRRVTEWTSDNARIFSAQCVAQRCEVTSEGNIHMYHYVDSSSVAVLPRIFDFTQQLLERFSRYYRSGTEGNPYYIVEMPKYGDISSGNVTGLQKTTWCSFEDKLWAQRGLAHELVHPFVRLAVDRPDPLWSVVIEGFPSYLHLPVMAEIVGNDFYAEHIRRIEREYLEKKRTGKSRRGWTLPKEVALLEIGADDLSTYKDEFVISDRIVLFFNYLYRKMGTEDFFRFTKDLCGQEGINTESFLDIIDDYLPGATADVLLWLETSEYPERFRVVNLGFE